jgi:cell division initiation protein
LKITPLDIRKQTFKRSMRGFDISEVTAFLEAVAAEFEGLVRENTSFAERMRELDEKIDDYRRLESTLKETLVRAQQTSAEQVENARKEANLTLQEARVRAQEAVVQAETRAAELEAHATQLRRQLSGFIDRFRSIIDAQLQMLDAQSAHVEGGLVVHPGLSQATTTERPIEEAPSQEPLPAAPSEEADQEVKRVE